MREDQASRTAEYNALFRALEARHPGSVRPATDRYAERFLSARLRAVTTIARPRLGHRLVTELIDRRWPGVRSSIVARTRLIDDLLCEIAGGVDQFVILGAGFDTRAYRLGCVDDLTTFEIDHPATQERKRRSLLAGNGVHYVAWDFHEHGLDRALSAAGFDPAVPTLFLWEGVTNYLTAETVDETIRWCSQAAVGSHLIFTYVDRQVLDDPASYHHADRVLDTSQRAGEKVTFGIPPADLAPYLAECGLDLMSDSGAVDYRALYYSDTASRIRGHEFYRVAHATNVVPSPDGDT